MKRKVNNAAGIPWIQVLVVLLLLAFLFLTYFQTPRMTDDQRAIVRFLMALLGGFAAYFIGGSVILHLRFFVNEHARVLLSATAGVAVFALLYLVAPYWYKGDRENDMERNPPSQTPSPLPLITPTPSVAATPRSSPLPAIVQSSPHPDRTPALLAATPTPVNPAPHLPAPTAAPVRKRGRVLVLIEDDIFAQALAQQLSDNGLEVVTEAELSRSDRHEITQSLAQLINSDLSAGKGIPYAVIVTGRISITQLGASDGTYRVEANGSLTAINTTEGQSQMRSLTPIRSGGNSPEAARFNVLREAGQIIPPFFIKQIILDARRSY